MEVKEGNQYLLTFPNGKSCKCTLKEKQYLICNYHYVFEPLAEDDRLFNKHENWKSLGWESPYWFVIPEEIFRMANPELLVNGELLSSEEKNNRYINEKVIIIDEFTPNDIKISPSRCSVALDDLLEFAKKNDLTEAQLDMVTSAAQRYVKKLQSAINED